MALDQSVARPRGARPDRVARERRSGGSHAVLARDGWPDFVWAFHDGDEIGPRMLARIAKQTGLSPEDL